MRTSMRGMNRMVFLILLAGIFLLTCKPPSFIDQYRPLVKTYIDTWNSGDFSKLEQVVSHKFTFRMSPDFKPAVGIDSLKQVITYWRTGYPDFHIEIIEEVYCLGRIAVRWKITATNTGPGNFPPTGKKVHVQGMSLIHVEGGKLIDEWVFGNNLAWLTQLGYKLIPPTSEGS